jgi:hypothetical protein
MWCRDGSRRSARTQTGEVNLKPRITRSSAKDFLVMMTFVLWQGPWRNMFNFTPGRRLAIIRGKRYGFV